MKIPPKHQFRTATNVERIKMGWEVTVEIKGLNIGPDGEAVRSESEAAVFAFTTLGKHLHADGFNVVRMMEVALNDTGDLFGPEEEG